MDAQHGERDRRKAIAALAVILVVAILAVSITVLDKKKNSGSQNLASGTAVPSSGGTGASNTSYKDGSYSAQGSYDTPGGTESISVNLTVKNGVVTDSAIRQQATNRETEEYQSAFAGGYKSQVVGKPLDSIQLSHVSGSSLTSGGFDDALQQIKSQARS